MSYAFDLSSYFEPLGSKPLLQGGIVELAAQPGKTFSVDRIFRGDSHCYVLLDQGQIKHRPRPKKPSELKELIENKTLSVISHGVLW